MNAGDDELSEKDERRHLPLIEIRFLEVTKNKLINDVVCRLLGPRRTLLLLSSPQWLKIKVAFIYL